jgi:hypothetical protein
MDARSLVTVEKSRACERVREPARSRCGPALVKQGYLQRGQQPPDAAAVATGANTATSAATSPNSLTFIRVSLHLRADHPHARPRYDLKRTRRSSPLTFKTT